MVQRHHVCEDDAVQTEPRAELFSSGVSQSMWHVVLGRVLSGSGGSGMASLVLVLTTGNLDSPIWPRRRDLISFT
jgi:hypothetical protein